MSCRARIHGWTTVLALNAPKRLLAAFDKEHPAAY
jgi:hypothetical protein